MSRSIPGACKRTIDIVVAANAFFLLSPCFVLLMLAVCVTMGWPPSFAKSGRVTRVALLLS